MEIAKMDKYLNSQDKIVYWADPTIAYWVVIGVGLSAERLPVLGAVQTQ